MATLTGLRLERAQASPQYRGGTFHNAAKVSVLPKGGGVSVAADFVFGGQSRQPRGNIPVHSPLEAWRAPVESGLRITWLGHSTTLVEIDGMRVLTDPVFGARASPVSFAGPKRFHAVPATLAQLPPLDAVLLSHDHYDHLCADSIRTLASMAVPIVTSLGVGAHLEALGYPTALITELDWWQHHTLGALQFQATPAQHFSGRGVTDRNATLWSSWVLRTDNQRVFFSGDTGLTDAFLTIRDRCGPFDLVMLEIGAWNAMWADIHLGPTNALKAFEMLGGGCLLPVHWGTFDLGLHPWAEPAEQLHAQAQRTGARVVMPMLGQPLQPAHVDTPLPWWRDLSAAR